MLVLVATADDGLRISVERRATLSLPDDTVITGATRDATLQSLQDRTPDLIVATMNPGVDLLQYVTQQKIPTSFVLCSGSSLEEVSQILKRQGLEQVPVSISTAIPFDIFAIIQKHKAAPTLPGPLSDGLKGLGLGSKT